MSSTVDVIGSVDRESGVGVVELRRPPHNFLDIVLLRALTDALLRLAQDPDCRAAVVCAEGKNFCAGRDFRAPRGPGDDSESMYVEASRLVSVEIPWVAAIQGAAVGAGLGVALCADFRVGGPRASFAASFVTHGLHHGFGLTELLPRVVGIQHATMMLYSGRRIDVHEALATGLVDRVTTDEADLRSTATSTAAELAAVPPAALSAIRATMRHGLADRFRAATRHESEQQAALVERGGTSRTPSARSTTQA